MRISGTESSSVILRFENKYTEDDIINMLEFLADNIFRCLMGEKFSNR